MLAWWLACTNGDGTTTHSAVTPTASTAETAAPATHTGGADPLPTAPDVAAATDAVTWAVDFAAGLSMTECAAAYDRVGAGATPSCPRYYEDGDPAGWNDECTTRDGTSFKGALIRWSDLRWLVDERLRTSLLDPYGPQVVSGWTPTAAYAGTAAGVGLDGEAQAATATSAWSFIGQGWSLTGEDRGLRLRHSTVEGGCTSDLPTRAPWIDEQHLVWMRTTQLWSDGSDALLTFVDGSIAAVPAPPIETVTFVEVTWLLGTPGACAQEPDGTIEVRDVDGRRWPLAFSSEACDGCADLVQVDGAVVGRVCPDLRPLRKAFVSAGDR